MTVEILFILHVVNGIHITIHNMSSLSKKDSLTYTMFEVSDGNSFSQRSREYFH